MSVDPSLRDLLTETVRQKLENSHLQSLPLEDRTTMIVDAVIEDCEVAVARQLSGIRDDLGHAVMHYRQLAIKLGAKSGQMLTDFDRRFAKSSHVLGDS